MDFSGAFYVLWPSDQPNAEYRSGAEPVRNRPAAIIINVYILSAG